MKKKLAISFLIALLVFSASNSMFTAASKTMKSQAEGGAKKVHSQNNNTGGIIAGTLQPYLKCEKQRNRSYKCTFTVKNQTERVQKVTFTSGKKYDYILYRNGKKVKQFSEGKYFIQIYQEYILKQAEELSFTETLTGLKKGKYKIEFWLADANWPNARASAEFTVD